MGLNCEKSTVQILRVTRRFSSAGVELTSMGRHASGTLGLDKWYEMAMQSWDLTEAQAIGDILRCMSVGFDAIAVRWQPSDDPAPVWWPTMSPFGGAPASNVTAHLGAVEVVDTEVIDGRLRRGTLTIYCGSVVVFNDRWARHGQDLLDCLRLVLARGRLRGAKGSLRNPLEEAGTEVAAMQRQLTVRVEAERRRLVADVLEDLIDSVDALTVAVKGAQKSVGAFTTGAWAASVDLIDRRLTEVQERFRQVARGIYPATLREHGVREALLAYAMGTDGRIRLTGDCGRRSSWQIESVLFRATLARIQQLAKTVTDGAAIDVGLGRRGEVLLVELRVPMQPSQETVGLALAVAAETDLIRAFGGEEVVGREGNFAIFRLSLSEKAFASF